MTARVSRGGSIPPAHRPDPTSTPDVRYRPQQHQDHVTAVPIPVPNVRPPPRRGMAWRFPDSPSSPWADPESAPTLLGGALYPSLNFTYFHLKDPVLERAEIFTAFCLLLYVFWHVPAHSTVCASADIFCRCNLSKTSDVLGLEVTQGMSVFVIGNTGHVVLTFSQNNPFEVRRSTHEHEGREAFGQ